MPNGSGREADGVRRFACRGHAGEPGGAEGDAVFGARKPAQRDGEGGGEDAEPGGGAGAAADDAGGLDPGTGGGEGVDAVAQREGDAVEDRAGQSRPVGAGR